MSEARIRAPSLQIPLARFGLLSIVVCLGCGSERSGEGNSGGNGGRAEPGAASAGIGSGASGASGASGRGVGGASAGGASAGGMAGGLALAGGTAGGFASSTGGEAQSGAGGGGGGAVAYEFCSTGVATFVHPGALHTQPQLERVKAGIAAHAAPYASAWAAFHPPSSGSRANAPKLIDDTNPYALQDQGHTVYQLAVYWALSGDAAYGSAAAEMLNAWSRTFTGPNAPDATLRVGLGAIQMINAAELLRYAGGGFAGYSPTDDAAFATMLAQAVYPTLHAAWTENGDAGWGTPCVAALAAAAIHTQNCAWLNEALQQFRTSSCVSIYQIVNDGRHGGAQFVGENAESGRDQGHVQGTVAHLAETAEMAWNQGLDLYGEGQNLLLAGMDYNAKYNLGSDVPFTPMSTCTSTYQAIAPAGRGSFSPVYEMVWNHYHNRRGLAATFIGQVRALSSYSPEASNGDHVGLGTLLYTRPFDAATPIGQ